VRNSLFDGWNKHTRPFLYQVRSDGDLGLPYLRLERRAREDGRAQDKGELPLGSELNGRSGIRIHETTEPSFLDKEAPPSPGDGGERDFGPAEQPPDLEVRKQPGSCRELDLPAQVEERGGQGTDGLFPGIGTKEAKAKLLDHPRLIKTVSLAVQVAINLGPHGLLPIDDKPDFTGTVEPGSI
jgi:hypothetical protein